ncbi:hypothetical protein Cal6303_2648 [Calothrix sp. PCC 6303]|nr:hypothetical protein Cal6303_2648 [Calothrix sp. PCC 6303]
MNIKQLRHIIKLWSWSAMHSQYFPSFQIRITRIIQTTSDFYPMENGDDFGGLHVYFSRPRIQVYVDWRAESDFISCFPQYENAEWLSLTAPF